MWNKLAVFFLSVSWTVTAIQRKDLFPYGTLHGDLRLQEGDDETSKVLTLTKPMYFYETSFSNLYVATNGIISTQDLPMEKQYVDDGFPTEFPVIAPFLADIDTSNGRGTIYYRQTESPGVLNRVAAEVQRGFPGTVFIPTHAVIATWENVAAYEERSSESSSRVNTFQAVVAYDEVNTYALFLYPEDGLQFFGTRPKETFNVEIELPARVGFTRGEIPYFIFARAEGPHYSVTSKEQSVKNLYQRGNSGVPGVWLFHIGSAYSFDNVIPAQTGKQVEEFRTTPEYSEEEYSEKDESFDDEHDYTVDPDFQNPTVPEFTEPDQDISLSGVVNPEAVPNSNPQQPYGGDIVLTSHTQTHDTASVASAPGPYAQSEPEEAAEAQHPVPEHTLLEMYPVHADGGVPHTPNGQVVNVDEDVNIDSGVIHYFSENKETCAHFRQRCSQNAYCKDYPSGYCCHCLSGFYGNGPHCLPNGAPQRVNGKVNGSVSVGSTPVRLNNIDLHTYVVVGDGRAYTAISEVPEPLGWALMPVAPIGGLFGWLFALKLPGSHNGFNITGADFTRHVDVIFYPGNQHLSLVQTGKGLDSQNYLIVDTHLEGSVPFMSPGATVHMEPYTETYQYYPSLITSNSVREFTVVTGERGTETFTFQVRQNITYGDCQHGPRRSPETLQLIVERIFVMYIKEERILRYAITNKIGHVGAILSETLNPCYSGDHDCDTTAQCLPGDGQLYTCQCATGYTGDGHNCYDIDECAESLSSCGPHAECVNLPGSHSCRCQSGFELEFNGRTCTDIDECRNQPCHHHASCSNILGSFYCHCQQGFHGDGFQCHPQHERPRTQCEQHRDSLRVRPGASPLTGAFIPQCDEQGHYRSLQCHPSTGHCWCVDSRGQERAGTRTPPGTPHTNCEAPVVPVPTSRAETVCERWRASLMEHYGGRPGPQHYLPQCDAAGEFIPVQCYGDSSYCWCVGRDGREVPGTRSHDAVKPACIPTVAPPTVHPLPRPDVTPPPSGTSLLYAQGQQIGVLPLNGTHIDKERSSILLALHGSIVVGIDYDCRERKIYWTDLAGRTISRAPLEPGAEPEILINTGLMSPEGLAVDVVRRKLFWVDSTPDKIESANLDGNDRRVLFNTDLVNPRAIVVDSHSGTLFWTDWNREAPKIESSTVDGHGRRVLVWDGIGLPNALTFDSTMRRVCWADAGTKLLECISPDGTGRRTFHRNLNYPFSMVFYANHFYYTDWRRDGVIAVSRDSSKFMEEYLPEQRSHLYGITVAPTSCL